MCVFYEFNKLDYDNDYVEFNDLFGCLNMYLYLCEGGQSARQELGHNACSERCHRKGPQRGSHVSEPTDEKKSSVACPLLCPLRRPPLLVSFLSLVLVLAIVDDDANTLAMRL